MSEEKNEVEPAAKMSGDGAGEDEKSTPGKSRKRMRIFLGDLLDSGDVPGLEWIDKEMKTFRMPWKHAKKKGYDGDKDTLLIKLWAQNTGRYRETNPDPTTWKINFRCALNSLRESIVEVETPPDEDCRIFRFEDSRRGRGKSMGASQANPSAALLYHAEKRKASTEGVFRSSSMEDAVDTLWQPDSVQPSTHSLQSLLADIRDPTKHYQAPLSGNEAVFEDRQPSTSTRAAGECGASPRSSTSTTDSGIDHDEQEHGDSRLVGPHDSIPACHEMYVKVSYRGSPVAGMRVTHQLGCRIFFGEIPEPGRLTQEEQERLFGSRHLMQLCLPQPASAQARLHSMWCLLDTMQRGIVLEVQNNDIYATRLCHAVVFWGAPGHDGHTCELQQGVRTKIFNYQAFLNIYRAYQEPERNGIAAEPPSYEVLLGAGQPWGPDRNKDNNLLMISVTHCLAETLMETLHRFRWENNCPFDTDYLMIDPLQEDDRRAIACMTSHPSQALMATPCSAALGPPAALSPPAILPDEADDFLRSTTLPPVDTLNMPFGQVGQV